ncbi:MAG TPA: hypothetical protein VGV69_06565 [Solirubrobacterales bacterium]|nr:hypothetical protein [Solirubrobacterales bacterium]
MGSGSKTPTQLRTEIVAHLEDFPHQLLALESAMEEFGEGFEMAVFKPAFERKSGIKAYNQVQAVERAFGRVQNYMVQLSESGAALAGLELPRNHQSSAARAFEALREAGAVDASLCRRLQRAQKARSAVEHSYIKVKAGRVHEAVELVAESARAFIGPYTVWIKPRL